jgi:hypothetical protein
MTLDTYSQNIGTASPRSHPYASSLSSSASSSTSSVFSDAASQASSSSSSTSQSYPSGWDSEEWNSRQAALATTADHTVLTTLAPISRVSTFPLYQPSACRESAPERGLPSLRTDLVVPAEQRQHPRRSSTTLNQRPPPQLVRQCERKVNFVDCLVG